MKTETTPQRLFSAPESRAAAKDAMRRVLQGLPDGVTLSAICRATNGEVLPQSIIVFRETGSGMGEDKLAALEQGLIHLGVAMPSPASPRK